MKATRAKSKWHEPADILTSPSTHGFIVGTAGDGLSGLTAIALVDIGLPEIDGYEVARRARERKSNAYLIALTGYGQDHDRRRAADSGLTSISPSRSTLSSCDPSSPKSRTDGFSTRDVHLVRRLG